eukprot:5474895-Heterocapsa_arctica.AAC.1
MARLETHHVRQLTAHLVRNYVAERGDQYFMQKTYRQSGSRLQRNSFQADSIHGGGSGRRKHQNE